jgi:hypothetical protein
MPFATAASSGLADLEPTSTMAIKTAVNTKPAAAFAFNQPSKARRSSRDMFLTW